MRSLPGIRPGDLTTAKYIDSVTTRLTLIGGVYITLICLMPQFLNVYFNVPFLSGWDMQLLIAVVVTMDFMAQVQSPDVSGNMIRIDEKRPT